MKTHYILSKIRYQLSPEKQLAIRACSIDDKIEGNIVYGLLWQAQNSPPPPQPNPIYETITRHNL